MATSEEVSGGCGVKIILRLTWVTFAVGTRWSALGVGVGLGDGGKAKVGRRRRGERERDETGAETELNE